MDMPPGNGDIHVTLSQEVKFTGGIIVTTPSKCAISAFEHSLADNDANSMPTLGIIENQAYFQADPNSIAHPLFGASKLKEYQEVYGIRNSISLPYADVIAKCNNEGKPFALKLGDDEVSMKFKGFTQSLAAALSQIEKISQRPHVRYETGTKAIIVRQADGKEKRIESLHLRSKCNCEACAGSFSRDSINPEVFPAKIKERGVYAVQIYWSDGHKSSIYSYQRLLSNEVEEYNLPPETEAAVSGAKRRAARQSK
jgi:DUF971 family protein